MFETILDFEIRSDYPGGTVERNAPDAPRGFEATNPTRSKKKTRVRVLNPSDHRDTVNLRYAEQLAQHGKAHLDLAALTLTLIEDVPETPAQRVDMAERALLRTTWGPDFGAVMTRPDPHTIATNRIGLPVIPHYSGRPLDDFIQAETHNAEQAVCDHARPRFHALKHKHVLELEGGIKSCCVCGRTWDPASGSKFTEAPEA